LLLLADRTVTEKYWYYIIDICLWPSVTLCIVAVRVGVGVESFLWYFCCRMYLT